MKTGYDAAFPPAKPPTTDVVLFYGGGDTPHIWTKAEIDAQPARYRMPIWVRSNPAQANATTDAMDFIAWLKGSIMCPTGVFVMLDLETAVDPPYVTTFGAALRSAGYFVAPYGSEDFIYQNPALDGYFPAIIGAVAVPSGCAGVQYEEDAGGGAYDLDYISDTVPLWDTQPTEPPPPPTNYPGDNVKATPINVEIQGGHGWYPSPVPAASVIAVMPLSTNPDDTGNYNSDLTLPHLVGVATEAGTHSPDGSLNFEGPTNGTFGMVVWSAT